MSYATYFFLSLALNLGVELIILWVLVRGVLKMNLSRGEVLFWGVIANVLSLPYLWFVFPLFVPPAHFVVIGEVFVVLLEAVVYAKAFKIPWRRALLLSCGANVVSFIAGEMLHKVLGG